MSSQSLSVRPKNKTAIIARAKEMRAEIAQIFSDAHHWNTTCADKRSRKQRKASLIAEELNGLTAC
jgi:hypothetical protein